VGLAREVLKAKAPIANVKKCILTTLIEGKNEMPCSGKPSEVSLAVYIRFRHRYPPSSLLTITLLAVSSIWKVLVF
jgi:hypothetical protein